MRGNWLLATSSTGGTGALTLSGVTGWPIFTAMMGSSGSRLVEYEIAEYTDSTKTVPAKLESGIGYLNLSTLALTRTKVEATYDGTTYKPNAAGDSPSALSFGTNAANIVIFCGPSVQSHISKWPFAGGGGYASHAYVPSSWTWNGFTIVDKQAICTPLIFTHRMKNIGSVTLNLSTNAPLSSTTSLSFGFYDILDDGNVGDLIAKIDDFATMATTGSKTGTFSTKVPPIDACWGVLLGEFDNAGDAPKVAAATPTLDITSGIFSANPFGGLKYNGPYTALLSTFNGESSAGAINPPPAYSFRE
jgi:hypothetical protein